MKQTKPIPQKKTPKKERDNDNDRTLEKEAAKTLIAQKHSSRQTKHLTKKKTK